ncbi:hypothetical protein E3N88_45099 [Mikania micrantha]|uniref:Transketolase-like pyrimidine-binding domain-containing protein n=1 Tax=Mikania micrantha TaxID=192012 RepID=A0A5N6LAC4_9ASTR|nr:hypothetical protein E3N88_45099 [Mikania micrantha]
MIETGEGVDWAVAEALAFATLLVEGNHVRLSGQDVERGTFSHRHSVVHDQETGERTVHWIIPVPFSRLTDSFLDGTSSVYLEELQRAWEDDPTVLTSHGTISSGTLDTPDDLDPAFYGFSEADLDREFFLGVWRMSGFLSENRPVQTLRSILTRLEQAYCGNIGYEYMHIADRERCNWLRDKIETPTPTQYNRERREVILDRLIWSTQFENFLATKWTAAKRFGLEGGETLIPGMKEMFDRSADLGVESIVIGMSHRGRLNVLGQGVVYETLHLSGLPNYTTGGTIHIVVNNQVAFTTDPQAGRSSQYCTDVAKALNAPIFHVMIIRNHPSSLEIYQNKLLESGLATKEDIDRIQSKVTTILNEEFLASKDYVPQRRDWLSAYWAGFKSPEQLSRIRNTGVKPEILKNVGKAITTLPETFKPHRAVKKIFADRFKMIETGEGVDWAVAEALAFATLLVEGNHVRLSGQMLKEVLSVTGILLFMIKKQGSVTVHWIISLSEFGVLGFELGYSMENPNSLVLWEAQFGDFSNGAQMSDDNPFVIPEMEPTLRNQIQTCNMQIVNVTTPANYFHVLRRQLHREFRKPLVVMSPKNLLRHKDCKSNLSEFDDVQGHPGFDKQGTRFKRLIKDQNDHSDLEEGIRRLVLCSGKVYYELDERRKSVDGKDVAICRVEQLCPFPYDLIQRELKRYPNAEIVWCQEEPMNMGAYSYIAPRLATAMKALNRVPCYMQIVVCHDGQTELD